jgi:lipid A 3-O-deacylase
MSMGKGWCRIAPTVLVLGLIVILTPLGAARAQNVTYSEFRFGVLKHDARFLGGKERGVDINPELNWQSPVSDAWAATVPAWLRWAVQPRPTLGGEFNTEGYTNQFYVGANWAWQLAGNVFYPGDGIILGYFFGPGFNDGEIQSSRPDRKALGSHVLFREALDLGYQFAPGWQISAFIDHVSNGGLAKQNQSINDVGARLGIRF